MIQENFNMLHMNNFQCFLFDEFYRSDPCSGRPLDLYPECTVFEFRPEPAILTDIFVLYRSLSIWRQR